MQKVTDKEIKTVDSEVQKPAVAQPEFGMMPKETLIRMANLLIKSNPEVFEMYFAIQEAMNTKVTLTPKE